jgi:2,3-bisphosphoglycerate-dependent phosphoglycerate mutase
MPMLSPTGSPSEGWSKKKGTFTPKTTSVLDYIQCVSLTPIGLLLVALGVSNFLFLDRENLSISIAIVCIGISIAMISPAFGFHLKKADREDIPLIVLLLRHGESTANVDPAVYESTPDHAIPLSERGVKMTDAAGNKIAQYLTERLGFSACPNLTHHKRVKCKLLVSPFRRTRETASLLLKTDLAAWITDVEESSLLVEQDWGMFEGTGLVKGKILYEKEYEHLQTQKLHKGKFWARMPLGESAFDVCQRVVSLFGSIQQTRTNAGEEGAEAQVIIVVSHGITSRAFIMMWCRYSPEWFDASSNFPNCAVRVLDSAIPGWDGGGLYGGFNLDGKEALCQPVLADPVQTETNELYYKFCTESRYHPIRRSSKHSAIVRNPSIQLAAAKHHVPVHYVPHGA